MTQNGAVHPMARVIEPQIEDLYRRLAELHRELGVAEELVAEFDKAGPQGKSMARAMQGQVGSIRMQAAKVCIQVRLLEKQVGAKSSPLVFDDPAVG